MKIKNSVRRAGTLIASTGAAMALMISGASTASATDSVTYFSYSTPNYGCGASFWSNTVHLTFQCDGNLVLYRNSDNHAMWATGTYRSPQPDTLDFSHLGWLQLTSSSYTCNIGSWPNQAPNGTAVVQDDGNFVFYNTSGVATWASNTYNNQQGNVDYCYS